MTTKDAKETPPGRSVEDRLRGRKPLMDIPPPTREQIREMRELGRKRGDEIADELEPLFVLTEETLRFRHE
jgi:hypothetical protein